MDIAISYALSGRRSEALSILSDLERKAAVEGMDPYLLAPIFTALGNKDQALAALEKAYEKRSFWMAFMRREPFLKPLHSDPRFDDLVRRIGTPQ
jgi:hypothetical protein